MRNIGLWAILIVLPACGFKPLYVEKESESKWVYDGVYNTSIIQEMSQIEVKPIADRFGQQVRNDLLDSLTPQGQPTNPKYHLYVELTEKEVVQQALRDDITATRERVKYVVKYSLEQNAQELVSGDSIAFVSYDIMANPYSTTFAQKKTETNAAKIIANDIVLRIGAYFNSKLVEKSE